MFTEKVSVTTTPPPPMRLVIVDDVDPGFIHDRSGRERRRPVLPTGPVHSGPASPVTATCPPSASRQSRSRRLPAIARHQLGDGQRPEIQPASLNPTASPPAMNPKTPLSSTPNPCKPPCYFKDDGRLRRWPAIALTLRAAGPLSPIPPRLASAYSPTCSRCWPETR